MASLTPKINPTNYADTNLVEGTMDFNPRLNKVYFVIKRNGSLVTTSIDSPPLEDGEIYANDIKFIYFRNRETSLEDYDYYDVLEMKTRESSHDVYYGKYIPRTDYMEKTFSASESATVLVFRNQQIKQFYTEIDVRIIDSNGNIIEPTNVAVVDEYCTVTIPITTSNGKCRVYFYNPIDSSNKQLKFNEDYSLGSQSLMPMNYIQWIEIVSKKFIELESEYDLNTDRQALVNNFNLHLNDILDEIYTHIGEVPIVGLSIEFNFTAKIELSVTTSNGDTPQSVSLTGYYNTTGDGLGYYEINNPIPPITPYNSITCNITSNNVSYVYDTATIVPNKIGYGAVKRGNEYYAIERSCNLGVHLS